MWFIEIWVLSEVHVVVTCWLRNDPLGVSYRPKTPPPCHNNIHGCDFFAVRVLFL
jgi:hypothetical protein